MKNIPDYKNTIFEADNILLSSNQFELPLNIEKLLKSIKTINIQIKKYSESGIEGIEEIKSSGFVKEHNGIYIVAYNDGIENSGHNRFTLCHELGHIVLKHDLSKTDDRIQETEADIFATELLMPEAIIQELVNRGYNIVNEVHLAKIFNASKTASQIRIKEFNKLPEWHGRYADYDSINNIQFKSYLDNAFPNRNGYQYDIDDELEEQKRRDEWL